MTFPWGPQASPIFRPSDRNRALKRAEVKVWASNRLTPKRLKASDNKELLICLSKGDSAWRFWFWCEFLINWKQCALKGLQLRSWEFHSMIKLEGQVKIYPSNKDLFFKLWQFGWSLCRDLEIFGWWMWVPFLYLEVCVLELFIFHQTNRFPTEKTTQQKGSALTASGFHHCILIFEGHFLFGVIKKSSILWCLKRKRKSLPLQKYPSSSFRWLKAPRF